MRLLIREWKTPGYPSFASNVQSAGWRQRSYATVLAEIGEDSAVICWHGEQEEEKEGACNPIRAVKMLPVWPPHPERNCFAFTSPIRHN
jgi:hypothetical protein